MRLHTFYLRFCGAVVGLYVLLFLSTALAGGLKGIAAAFLSPFAIFLTMVALVEFGPQGPQGPFWV
jgi:hypothetical protein